MDETLKKSLPAIPGYTKQKWKVYYDNGTYTICIITDYGTEGWWHGASVQVPETGKISADRQSLVRAAQSILDAREGQEREKRAPKPQDLIGEY